MQNQTFVDNCKEQLDGNASWISEMLEITKFTESPFDATKQDISSQLVSPQSLFFKN